METLTFNHPLTLGQNARLLRVAAGLRQYELALLANVSPSWVSALERDFRLYATARTRILRALGLEVPDEQAPNAKQSASAIGPSG